MTARDRPAAPRGRQRPGPIVFEPDRAVPGPDDPRRGRRSTCAPSCAAPGKGSSGRVHHPRPLSRIRVGAQMRYAVHDRPAGHSPCSASPPPPGLLRRHLHRGAATGEKNLPFVVGEIPDPALDQDPQSGLARLAHPPAISRLWTERNTTPVIIETVARYTGAVYRASGWIHVGATQGRYDWTGSSTSRKRMSGGPCDETGNAASIAKIRRGG